MAIQLFFIFGVLVIDPLKFTLFNNTLMQLTLFFTTLLLHLGNLGMFRSGLNMMKYSLCHPEEFTHPKLAFFLGMMYMLILVVSEWINIMKGTNRKTPQAVITSYIGFKVISDLPKLYIGSIQDIPIKAAIKPLVATKGRKDGSNNIKNHWLQTGIYCLTKWFYASVYFYFFSFGCIYLPLLAILYEKA